MSATSVLLPINQAQLEPPMNTNSKPEFLITLILFSWQKPPLLIKPYQAHLLPESIQIGLKLQSKLPMFSQAIFVPHSLETSLASSKNM